MIQKLNTVGKEICNIEDNKAKFDKQVNYQPPKGSGLLLNGSLD